METDQLIRQLSDECTPVRPLSHPARRTAAWFMVSAIYVLAVARFMGLRPDITARLAEWRFVGEVAAAFLTSLMAAAAALCAGCPGRPIWERFAPLPFLALWLGLLGEGCWRDWISIGAEGLAVRQDLMCPPIILAISAGPAVAIFLMVRRGAPLAPLAAMGLAALAAAALAAAALRIVHIEDSSVMVLVWQFGSVALLTGIEALFGDVYIRWTRRDELLAAFNRLER